MILRRLEVVVLGALCFASSSLAGQASLTACNFVAPNGFNTDTTPGQQRISTTSGGITVTCPSRNIILIADRAMQMGQDRLDLFGKVHYTEPAKIDLQSDSLTYLANEERVVVRGHVIATLPSGSTLTGPAATYLRVIPGRRAFEELTAIQSPTVTIAAQGDSGKPVSITATTIFMRGDSLIYASRKVVIIRSDLIAHSDSAFLDGRSNQETMRLMFTPSVEGLQGRKFRLEGEIIDAYSKERKLERVIARGKGHATSQDLDIVADTIDLRMSNDALEHAIAWSRTGQAKATSPGETIVADSIDVLMPKQKVTVVYAVGHAFAQADADTVRFRTTEKDWLRGETIVAWFDTTATKDTSTTPPIRQILATHHADSAQAYYHMAPSDTGVRSPAISYVRGRQIRLDFVNRKVALVSVRDSVAGLYLEPQDSAKAAKATKASSGKPSSVKAPPGKSPAAKPPASAPVRKPPAPSEASIKKPEAVGS
jgi:lipopolysaccharide export system protein LptA